MTEFQFAWVQDQLCNNDVADDAEMRDFFLNQINITEEETDIAMSCRDMFIANPFMCLDRNLFTITD